MTYQVYPWVNEYPPYQFNWCYRNSTQLWAGPDNERNFEKHLSNKESCQLLKNLGWDTANIAYQYNSHGFRCEEFDNRPCGIAVGCSFTHGVGLPIEKTWPYLVSQLIGIHVWNLGSGGASIDTVFRIFDYYVTKLSPKFVALLIPPIHRFEYCDVQGGFPILSVSDYGNQPLFAKEWLSQEKNAIYNTRKTILAMERICINYNIPLIIRDSQDGPTHNNSDGTLDLARDLQHSGVRYQEYHANYMCDKIKELNL